MRSFALAAVVVMMLGHHARADSAYIGFGFGAARLEGDLDRLFDTESEVGGRIIGGLRWGDTALEVSFFGTDVHGADGVGTASGSTLSLGIGIKQYVSFGEHFSIYGRAGLDYTWLVNTAGSGPGYAGRGYDLGTGAQLDWRWHRRATLSEVAVGVWLDVGIQRMRLEAPPGRTLDGGLAAVNPGFTLSLGW